LGHARRPTTVQQLLGVHRQGLLLLLLLLLLLKHLGVHQRRVDVLLKLWILALSLKGL
jgi:hypothetical protein